MKEKIKNLKSTPRGRAIIKLSLYMVFFFFVLILVAVSNSFRGGEQHNNPVNNDKGSTEVEKLTFLDKQKKLYEGDYSFVYRISDETNEVNMIYLGQVKDSITEGTKETSDGVIKYYIENNTIYQIILDEKHEYDSLYTGLDANLFDFKQIFDKLNSISAIISKNGENVQLYSYEDVDGYSYTVHTDATEIMEIIIESDNLSYDFVFNY